MLAQCLKAQLRSGDVVARYGGEEFAILLPQTGYELAQNLAERLRQSIQELVLPEGAFPRSQPITVSLGLATYPEHTQRLDDLVTLADQALYEAKGTGRNRVVCAGNLGQALLSGNLEIPIVRAYT